MGKYAMGVDSGSVSTDFVLIDEKYQLVDSLYLRTHGDPMGTIAQGMGILRELYRDEEITAVGTTGSGRQLAGRMLGADVIKMK